jgi:hypothetical protein
MADIEAAVYAVLTGDVTLSALVGGRVYPQPIPQEAALPAVAYQRISTRRVRSHSGPSGLARPRVQVTASANSYAQAKAVAAAVRGALDGLRATVAGVEVQGAWLDGDVDEYGDDGELRSVRMDFMFWHRED